MSEQAMTSPWHQRPQPSDAIRLEVPPLLRPPKGSVVTSGEAGRPSLVPKTTLGTSHLLVPALSRNSFLQSPFWLRLFWKLHEHRGQLAMIGGVLAVSVAVGLVVATVLA